MERSILLYICMVCSTVAMAANVEDLVIYHNYNIYTILCGRITQSSLVIIASHTPPLLPPLISQPAENSFEHCRELLAHLATRAAVTVSRNQTPGKRHEGGYASARPLRRSTTDTYL